MKKVVITFSVVLVLVIGFFAYVQIAKAYETSCTQEVSTSGAKGYIEQWNTLNGWGLGNQKICDSYGYTTTYQFGGDYPSSNGKYLMARLSYYVTYLNNTSTKEPVYLIDNYDGGQQWGHDVIYTSDAQNIVNAMGGNWYFVQKHITSFLLNGFGSAYDMNLVAKYAGGYIPTPTAQANPTNGAPYTLETAHLQTTPHPTGTIITKNKSGSSTSSFYLKDTVNISDSTTINNTIVPTGSYRAIQLVYPDGTTKWLEGSGTGNYDSGQMVHTDENTHTISVTPSSTGTYTVHFWIRDQYNRISAEITKTFSVSNPTCPSGYSSTGTAGVCQKITYASVTCPTPTVKNAYNGTPPTFTLANPSYSGSDTTYTATYTGNGNWSYTSSNGTYTGDCKVVSTGQYQDPTTTFYQTWTAYSTYSSGTKGNVQNSSTVTGYSYGVKKVVITVTPNTYEGRTAPTVSCTETYYDGTTGTCTPSLYGQNNYYDHRTVGYDHTDSWTKAYGYAATNRWYSYLTLSGPTKVYGGIPAYFSAGLNWFGTTPPGSVDVSVDSTTWSSASVDFFNDSYTDPHGTVHKPTQPNELYSYDPSTTWLTISADHALPNQGNFPYTSIPLNRTSVSNQTGTTNEGINSMKITTTGGFQSGNNPNYQTQTLTLPSNNLWSSVDFITGHYYNFHAYIEYADGTNGMGTAGYRDITSAPFVYWTTKDINGGGSFATKGQTIWYPGLNPYQKSGVYTSGFTYNGYSHRIPRNNVNYVTVQYLDNTNFGSFSNQTVRTGTYWSHQPIEITIRGNGTTYLNNNPVVGSQNPVPPNPSSSQVDMTPVKAGDTEHYTAWVTWSDQSPEPYLYIGWAWTPDTPYAPNPFGRGQKQNWSQYITWNGDDYAKSPGTYTFQGPGTFEHSITAAYTDKYASAPWTNLSNSLDVYVEGQCLANTSLAPGCPTKQSWQTNPPGDGTTNFLPPPGQFGLGGWDPSTDPYDFTKKFGVTGISPQQ